MPIYQIRAEGLFLYTLVLNPITANVESGVAVGQFHTGQAAKEFYEGELVEPYSEDGPSLYGGETKSYRKHFRKGGPLENFNHIEFLNGKYDWDNEEGFSNNCGHGLHLVMQDLRNIDRGVKIGETI
jgi:hypothetical protein